MGLSNSKQKKSHSVSIEKYFRNNIYKADFGTQIIRELELLIENQVRIFCSTSEIASKSIKKSTLTNKGVGMLSAFNQLIFFRKSKDVMEFLEKYEPDVDIEELKKDFSSQSDNTIGYFVSLLLPKALENVFEGEGAIIVDYEGISAGTRHCIRLGRIFTINFDQLCNYAVKLIERHSFLEAEIEYKFDPVDKSTLEESLGQYINHLPEKANVCLTQSITNKFGLQESWQSTYRKLEPFLLQVAFCQYIATEIISPKALGEISPIIYLLKDLTFLTEAFGTNEEFHRKPVSSEEAERLTKNINGIVVPAISADKIYYTNGRIVDSLPRLVFFCFDSATCRKIRDQSKQERSEVYPLHMTSL